MAITAAQVNDLRKNTGAGMMDCKNALVEADGNIEKAIEILRKKGQKIAAKRGDNEAKEGLVIAKNSSDGKAGVILALNCETDFVAKNDDFKSFVEKIVDIATQNLPNSIEELVELNFEEGLTVKEKIVSQIGVIGEKLDLSNYAKINAENVVAYNHPGNQLATLVGMNKSGNQLNEAGKQVAMQVAAMNPIALKEEDVDAEITQKEFEIGKEMAIKEGKPAEMVDKIAQGRLKKFFKENTLLSQPFVRDNKLSVQQFLSQTDDGLTVTEFKRIALS